MQKLTWPQVNAWRLAQQQLLERAEFTDLLSVVARLGGLQAQLTSAAELALWARVKDVTPAAIQRLLWAERKLVKTWAMRGTLHWLPRSEFAGFVAASAAITVKRPPSYYTYHKVTPAELEAIIATIPVVLSANPITREQMADAVAERTSSPNLRDVLLSGWGALLKPSARCGEICFGPCQGQNVTFVRPEAWLGDPALMLPKPGRAPIDALQACARCFLTTYGPATLDEFARWWGIDAAQARKLFKLMADELTTVEVDGWTAQILTNTLDAMTTLAAPSTVRLLPYFDPYTIAIARHADYLLPAAHKNQVYRTQGWISPVVLVDGRMVGVWEQVPKREKVTVRVALFDASARQFEDAIAAEVTSLGKFLDSEANWEINTQ